MIPVTVHHHDKDGDRRIETLFPGLPPIGYRWTFVDKDRGMAFKGEVTDVDVFDIDGDVTTVITVEEL